MCMINWKIIKISDEKSNEYKIISYKKLRFQL